MTNPLNWLEPRSSRVGKSTAAQRALIGQWNGWGTVAAGLDERLAAGTAGGDRSRELREKLVEIGGSDQLYRAEGATLTSYYTVPEISERLWSAATGLGFDGGKVLEAGSGSGHVVAAAPEGVVMSVTAVERDPFTADLFRMRFPQHHMENSALQDVRLTDEAFDLAIGNVPYSSVGVADNSQPVNFALHNYFLWRMGQSVRRGGLAVVLTSRYTLDNKKSKQRQELAKYFNLVGAIRLPSGAHSEAGTHVVSDILVLQRPLLGDPKTPEPWMNTYQHIIGSEEVTLNEYWGKHPEHILGRMEMGHGLYNARELLISPNGSMPAIMAELDEAVKGVIAQGQEHKTTWEPNPNATQELDISGVITQDPEGRLENSIHLINGEVQQIIGGKAQPIQRLGHDNLPEMAALIRIRDAASALLIAEEDFNIPDNDDPDNVLNSLRLELNVAYDSYVDNYGYLSRSPSLTTTKPAMKTLPS